MSELETIIREEADQPQPPSGRTQEGPESLAPAELYKEPDLYEATLRQRAQAADISLERGDSWPITLAGGGRTLTIGVSGRVYKGEAVSEPIQKIIYFARSPSARIHELTHVEQRLADPSWRHATLEEMEIEASTRSLEAFRGRDYPLSTINQLVNLGLNKVKLGVKRELGVYSK